MQKLTVGNNRHVSDIGWTVHQRTDLVDGEIDHDGGSGMRLALEAGVVGLKPEAEGLRTAFRAVSKR